DFEFVFIAQFHKNSTPNVRFFLSNFWGAVHHQAVSSLLYRHLVFLLLLRRARKQRFLISNFKHSTGVFELALPD
ncbi:hypothetical protein RFK21_09650, partial [Streptococcus suis]